MTDGRIPSHEAGDQLDVARFVTHHYAMNDMLEAYDTFGRAADTGALKVVITRDAKTQPTP